MIKRMPKTVDEATSLVEACKAFPNLFLASQSLKIPRSTLHDWHIRAKQIILTEELQDKIPDHHYVKGISALYSNGEKVLEWVKTNRDEQKAFEAQQAAIKALCENIPPEIPSWFKRNSNDQLCTNYVITDYHLGMLSWPQETGEKWDIKIAERTLVNWFQEAIHTSPDSEVGIFCQLGDFLHTDSMIPATPTSGHILDADTRYQKMVEVTIRVMRRIINMMLKKHKHVHVIQAEGNHDMTSSIWLRAMFTALYENEPRITIDNTHTPYYAYEWGKTALFFHHGHKSRVAQMSKIFASQYRELFGRTEYAYAHTGHMHHVDVKEDSLMIVEQHPTLSAKDAYAVRGGYHSNRGANVITYHKEKGEVSRLTIRPEIVT